MRKSLSFAIVAVCALGLALPRTGLADTVTQPLLIGSLSFDSGIVPGYNSFDLTNLTGGIISPDGIADAETFSGTLTVDVSGVGNETYTYSGVDINGNNATLASFLPSADILSATLSLTLSNSTGVNVYGDHGGATVVNLEPVADTTLVSPATGSAAAIYVNAEPTGTVIPEPSTLWLLGSGLASILATKRRWLGMAGL